MSLIENMQYKIKTTSSSFFVFTLRLFTGMFLGLSLTIIGHEILEYGEFLYWFVLILTTGVFLRISKSWGPGAILIFNLVCILIGTLLRMYILIAPGE
jgi:hypothetical protein